MSRQLPLALWASFVLVFAALSYSVRFSEGKPDRDTLYHWSTAVAGLAQFVVLGLIVYGIAGLGQRWQLLALRRPTSWSRAIGISFGIGVVMAVLLGLLSPVLKPGQEQGLTPTHWEPSHAAAYVANGIVVAVVAPIVEELTFRGLGYSLLLRFGQWAAIVLVGVFFALAHGLVEGFPFLAALGAMLAYLRSRVDSVVPGMVVHALFNAIALVLAVAG